MGEFDNFDHLSQELGLQRRFKYLYESREEMEHANTDIEKSIADMEAYLGRLDATTFTVSADNEWKVRYECSVNENFLLRESRTWLETELTDARWKLQEGMYPEAMNYNLGTLTELELINLVKQMERMLKKGQNRMEDFDRRMKEEIRKYEQLDEIRRASRTELRIVKQTTEKIKLEELIEKQSTSAGQPSLYTSVTPSFRKYMSDIYGVDDHLSDSVDLSTKESQENNDDGSTAAEVDTDAGALGGTTKETEIDSGLLKVN